MSMLKSIPKYVIESPERRMSFIGNQFGALGIKYFSIQSTFYDHFPTEFDKKESWVKSKRHLSLPELGTATSHIKCYEKIVSTKIPFALIFEDDCQIVDVDELDKILSLVNGMDLDQSFVVSFFTNVANLKISQKYDSFLFSVVNEPSSTVCYFLTNSAAKALLKTNRNLIYVADWPKNSGVEFYLAKKKYIVTDLVKSLISDNRGSTNVSSSDRFRLMISIFSGIHFLVNKKYFKSYREYASILIVPALQRQIIRIFSTVVPEYGYGVKLQRKVWSIKNYSRPTSNS